MSGRRDGGNQTRAGKRRPEPQRPWLGVFFSCCRAYARIRLNQEGTAFAGHCPRCARSLRIEVSPDGSPGRFWVAG